MHAVWESTVVSGETGDTRLLCTRGGGDGWQSSEKHTVENPRLCESNGPDIECEMLPEGPLKALVKPTRS